MVNSMTGMRKILVASFAVLCLSAAAVIGAKRVIERKAKDGIESSLARLPPNEVGLVLGCAPTLSSGRTNEFFRNRLRAAAELFRHGKVSFLLVSGDNHAADYDEPTAMKNALCALGVPADRIICDYAGFSTFDSIVRANKVFGLSHFTLITQREHALRAVFIARHQGLDVVAFPADDVPRNAGLRTHFRESIARVAAVLSVTVIPRMPRFLGPPIKIGKKDLPRRHGDTESDLKEANRSVSKPSEI